MGENLDTEPDLSSRPYDIELAYDLESPASAYYSAWTEKFDRWFAEPGTLTMNAVEGGLYFFETHFEGQRHPHYGRFLTLKPNEVLRLTWLTGNPGTNGAETVITIRLIENDDRARLEFSHAGFADEKTRDAHAEPWKYILKHLDQQLVEGAF